MRTQIYNQLELLPLNILFKENNSVRNETRHDPRKPEKSRAYTLLVAYSESTGPRGRRRRRRRKKTRFKFEARVNRISGESSGRFGKYKNMKESALKEGKVSLCWKRRKSWCVSDDPRLEERSITVYRAVTIGETKFGFDDHWLRGRLLITPVAFWPCNRLRNFN